jgi:hypothetical protein
MIDIFSLANDFCASQSPEVSPMTDQSKDIPNQRGTSSGEIGQNPVEIIGKPTVPPGGKSAVVPKVKEEESNNKG